MDVDLIINILDDHNEASILMTEKYKPKKVLFFYDESQGIRQVNRVKRYYSKKFPKCEFLCEKIDICNYQNIENLIPKGENLLLNLTSGQKLTTLIIFMLCRKNNIPSQYLDIEKEEIIDIDSEKVKVCRDSFVDLDVEDVITSIGGSIVVDSTDICNIRIVNKLTNLIAENLDKWEDIKGKLRDNNIFIHDDCNPGIIRMNSSLLNNGEKDFYNKLLRMLRNENQIAFNKEDEIIKIRFLNEFIKSFLFKSGTWLEVFTKNMVEEIEVIDDVKSGVLFLWNDEKRRVKNELDVVAVRDSVLICISCKDSKKYDENALNELNVYAEQLGGENVIKILVATKEPMKTSTSERAKEMNISLVIYDGNKEKFRSDLKRIICT